MPTLTEDCVELAHNYFRVVEWEPHSLDVPVGTYQVRFPPSQLWSWRRGALRS